MQINSECDLQNITYIPDVIHNTVVKEGNNSTEGNEADQISFDENLNINLKPDSFPKPDNSTSFYLKCSICYIKFILRSLRA